MNHDAEDAENFIENLEHCRNVSELTFSEIMETLPVLLSGEAKVWFKVGGSSCSTWRREIEETAEIDKAYKSPPGDTKTREEDKSLRKNREALSTVFEISEKKSEKRQESDAIGKNAKRSDDEEPKKKEIAFKEKKARRSSQRHSDKGDRKETSSHSGHRSSSSDELGAIAAAQRQGQRRPTSSSRAPGGQKAGRDYACAMVDSTIRWDAGADITAGCDQRPICDHTRVSLYSSAVATDNVRVDNRTKPAEQHLWKCEKSEKRAVELTEEARAVPADSLCASGRAVRFTDPEPWRDSSMSNTDYEYYASESEPIDLRDSSTSNSEDESNPSRPDLSAEESSEKSVCSFTS
ncbi:uncharacterized protein [Prorops nasuta]|uniref:uncharacterized protein n=1 Tax=Prorops nasuta TaxID=863751 RepID=UPI0034CD21DA